MRLRTYADTGPNSDAFITPHPPRPGLLFGCASSALWSAAPCRGTQGYVQLRASDPLDTSHEHDPARSCRPDVSSHTHHAATSPSTLSYLWPTLVNGRADGEVQ